MPAVYLIRHGQASFGAGNYDVLSPAGHQQAEVVVQELVRRKLAPSIVESGSLQRQIDTAAAVSALLPEAPAPVADPRWNEYDHMAMLRSRRAATLWAMAGGNGRDRGRSIQKILDESLHDWASSGKPDASGTTWIQFAQNAWSGIEDLLNRAGSGGTALVFTSGGVIAAACARALGLGADGFVQLNRVTVNTGITTFTGGRSGISLLSFNEHSHVAGQPGLLTYR